MKRYCLLILLAIIGLNTNAKTKKEIIPPGTIKVSENFYFDQTEITNFSWLEYMYWAKEKYGKTSEQYLAVIPDTAVWGENSPFAQHYLRHPSYQNYPVVGVSYEQAVAYCAWRSKRVNEFIFAKKNKIEYHYFKEDSTFTEIPQIFTYRLPTEEEWNLVANAGFSKRTLRKKTSEGNLKSIAEDENKMETTTPVTAYWPNIYGVFNMIGNVAEMVSVKGVSKGGSWTHSLEDSQADKVQNYTGPTRWLGFRCVCERNS